MNRWSQEERDKVPLPEFDGLDVKEAFTTSGASDIGYTMAKR